MGDEKIDIDSLVIPANPDITVKVHPEEYTVFDMLIDALDNFDWTLVQSTNTKSRELGRKNFTAQCTSVFHVAERKDSDRAKRIWNERVRSPIEPINVFVRRPRDEKK